jgi:hypothetical protein
MHIESQTTAVQSRVAGWYIFIPKITPWVYFGGAACFDWNKKMWQTLECGTTVLELY